MAELTPESREASERARLKGISAWKTHTSFTVSHYAGLASGGPTLKAPDAKILEACVKAEYVHRQAVTAHLRVLSLDLPEHLRCFHAEQEKVHRAAAEHLGHLADEMKEVLGPITGINAWIQAVQSVLCPAVDHLDVPERKP